MEATNGLALRFSTPIGCQRIGGKQIFVARFNKRCNESTVQAINSINLQWRSVSSRQKGLCLGLSHACSDSITPALQSGNFHACFDQNWLLKTKGQEVASYLDNRSLFLVGMMGSGKTTVGKILSDALGYSFVDSDKYVEQAVGGSSVAQIFEQYGESFFRDNESRALQKLSLMPHQVVATGGGAVIRPINWEHMRHGITIFLDVPLDALARRIAAVGTDSRPLLDFDAGDPYTKAFMGLFTLSKKRVQAYSDADVTVSLSYLADNLGLEDVSDLTPAAIATEVLVQIENYLK